MLIQYRLALSQVSFQMECFSAIFPITFGGSNDETIFYTADVSPKNQDIAIGDYSKSSDIVSSSTHTPIVLMYNENGILKWHK